MTDDTKCHSASTPQCQNHVMAIYASKGYILCNEMLDVAFIEGFSNAREDAWLHPFGVSMAQRQFGKPKVFIGRNFPLN